MKQFLIGIIDLFYPPFSFLMDRRTFRYLACGGGNTLLDIFLYFISYNFILLKHPLDLTFVVISPHIAAFIFSFGITFPIGFLLMRYIVFTDSDLRGRVQLFRYMILVTICILLNYVFLKIFVEQLHFYPTVAKIFTTIIVVGFSYFSQRHFTFKVQDVKS